MTNNTGAEPNSSTNTGGASSGIINISDNSPQDVVIFVEGNPAPGGANSTNNRLVLNSSDKNMNNSTSCRQSGASVQSYPQTERQNLEKKAKNNGGSQMVRTTSNNSNSNKVMTLSGTSDLLKKSLDAINNSNNKALLSGVDQEENNLTSVGNKLRKKNIKNKNINNPSKKQRTNSEDTTTSEKTTSGDSDADERNGMLDIAEMKPTPPILVIMLVTFFVLYVSQVFVFDILGSNGIPFRGGGGLDRQAWGLIPEIPNYFAMAMVGFLPCKKTLWQLNRRQVLSAIFVATIDLTAQCLSKTGQVMLNQLTVYIIINSAFSIIFTAIGARCALGKKLNIGQYLGIMIVIGGVVISAFAKAQQRSAEEELIHKNHTAAEVKAREEAEQTAESAFYFGLILVILSTVADGIGFVSNEKLMNEGVKSIPGTLLCCIIGLWNSMILLIWQVAYTFPRWKEIITDPLDYLYNRPDPNHGVDVPKHTYGRADTIFQCIMYIFVSGFFCRVATMYLLKHVGAITFVVIKMLKIGAVATISVLMGMENFNVLKTCAAAVITFGVGVYSYAKIRSIMGEKSSCVQPMSSSTDLSSSGVNGKLVNIDEELGSRRGGNSNAILVEGDHEHSSNFATDSCDIEKNIQGRHRKPFDSSSPFNHVDNIDGSNHCQYNDLESCPSDAEESGEKKPFLYNSSTQQRSVAEIGGASGQGRS